MRVRGAKIRVKPLGRSGGILIRPRSRLISAGVAAAAIGFALGLRAVPSGASITETIQSKNLDPRDSFRLQLPDRRGVRVASLETEVVFESATEDTRSESAWSTTGRASFAEYFAVNSRAASFDERFAGAADVPGSRQATDYTALPWPDLGGRAADRRAVGQSARALAPLSPLPPARVSKKQVRVAEAAEDSSVPPDVDDHTAIYDIVSHRVYLPNGQRLEAHSGLGSYLDDPRYVSEKDRGPTPPNVYDVSLREELFHGVRAVRLNPVGGGNMFGRDGMLAHSYMLGPNGQSNGCVSFSDYPAFLNAVLSGEVTRLVVVEHLATAPSPKTASSWLPETIKAIFGRAFRSTST
jgi:hypothetical protein